MNKAMEELLFTAPLKNAVLRTATRFAMHRNGKKHRFAPLNSGFSLKLRVKTPRGIAAVNSNWKTKTGRWENEGCGSRR